MQPAPRLESTPPTPADERNQEIAPNPSNHEDSLVRTESSTDRTNIDDTPNTVNLETARDLWRSLAQKLSPSDRKRYFSGRIAAEVRERSSKIQKLLLQSAAPGPLRSYLEAEKAAITNKKRRLCSSEYTSMSKELLDIERQVRSACSLYNDMFPSEIWSCCRSSCFASILIDPSNLEVVGKLRRIHVNSKKLQQDVENAWQLVEIRRRGVGGSNVVFSAPSRDEREREDDRVGTDRKKRAKMVWDYVGSQLSYLQGIHMSCDGVPLPNKRICTEAIRLLLCVSRSFLYHRRVVKDPENAAEHVITSLVDTIGLRQRQERRIGKRTGYPTIQDMGTFDCGCDEPCFSGVPEWRLERMYNDFAKISTGLKPRCKEHQFLLNIMFCPLSNSTVKQCNRSIAMLFTISEGVVGAIRRNLDRICEDQSLEDYQLREGWDKLGYTYRNHPILRYDAEIRANIELHLNMVLRADPAGGVGVNVCRVYSPEVNTHEKLRKLLSSLMNAEKEDQSQTGSEPPVEGESQTNNGNRTGCERRMSSSTMQRIIDNYLETRNLRIVFQQTDHNACPNCKAMEYALTQYHLEYERLKMKRDVLLRSEDRVSREGEIEALKFDMDMKKDQEKGTEKSLRSHAERDLAIRKYIKVLSDHFRVVENEYIEDKSFKVPCPLWNRFANHAMITHQDDMTKVDLPYFVRSASADITRWRFDVNAHVNAVNGDSIVFSHEQGTGPKNAGSIVEEILLDHIVRCRGESIKVIVSDNASVGKNWLCTIALPQYIVDQGLAEVVLVVFLENNHGKWLADMLFGQLQTRRRRTTLLGVDDLLKEFESINRKRGTVRGFALNPLSSVDFSAVFESLGYETKPPKEFAFTRRITARAK